MRHKLLICSCGGDDDVGDDGNGGDDVDLLMYSVHLVFLSCPPL